VVFLTQVVTRFQPQQPRRGTFNFSHPASFAANAIIEIINEALVRPVADG